MVMKQLRNKKTAKKIWFALIIIILPAFVFWGLGSASRARGKISYAGKLFGKKISFEEYAQAYNAVLMQGAMRWGEENFEKIAKLIDLRQESWSRLILLKSAQKNKISVSDKELALFIESLPYFQYKGKFDLKTYKDLLQYSLHIDIPTFEQHMRGSLIIAKLYDKATAEVKLSDEQIREIYRKVNEEISLDYIVAETSAKEKIEAAKEKISQGKDFSAAAKESGLKSATSPLFNRSSKLESLEDSALLYDASAGLKDGQASEILDTGKNLYIIKIKQRNLPPINEEKFSAEKEDFSKKALSLAKDSYFNKYFLELKQQANLVDNTQNLKTQH